MNGTDRKWLTYCEENHTLYCGVCLAFAKPSENNPFVSGMQDWNHISQRVEEYERTIMHRMCAEAYFLRASKSDIASLLHGSQVVAHRDQVKKKRQVLERVVDVVKFIGKRGLGYRGKEYEAAYTLDDDNIDHGNFLELIILLGKYDVCLKEHITECTEKSKKMHQSHSQAKGRGSAVTFLSKTTVNNVISTVQRLIQETIAKEVAESGMFSVQIDTTQDITSHEQCSVILRYVTDTVQERLLAVVKCEASTGQYFVQMLTDVMDRFDLDISNCISNATDGASNMQGQYRGFSALLSSKVPNHSSVKSFVNSLDMSEDKSGQVELHPTTGLEEGVHQENIVEPEVYKIFAKKSQETQTAGEIKKEFAPLPLKVEEEGGDISPQPEVKIILSSTVWETKSGPSGRWYYRSSRVVTLAIREALHQSQLHVSERRVFGATEAILHNLRNTRLFEAKMEKIYGQLVDNDETRLKTIRAAWAFWQQ
ncbi:uncharacterized protein LOC117554399 [Gymnodraco acuticeps]|uniref:Uncharacterized protein LOC117554399 n=1 Tax=Gymnodraco acuticeps TaxID=8218 RepID=A0A6P8VE28_GYMAC|nr:uncharacterized protein LOC117554399 [Gymnodraco acuticeps]